MNNDRGMVMPVTLIIMVVMLTLAVGLLAVSGTEPLIARNFADTTQARLAAEAGLESTLNTLAATVGWSSLLSGADANGVTLVRNAPIGTLSAARGVYTVVLRNDTLAGDQARTGVAPDTSPTADANDTVFVTATGVVGNATKTLQVVVKRLTLPAGLFAGALSFPGIEAETSFSGTSFEIDGNGWLSSGSGTDASCAAVYGVAVSSGISTGETSIEKSLSSAQKKLVTGKSGTGTNTIVAVANPTAQAVQSFIDRAKGIADITLASHGPTGLGYSNLGATCASNPNDSTCWGYQDATGKIVPKIVYVKGDVDATSQFRALTIDGASTGYGVLIIEDGDVALNGTFVWHGPIIVTGRYVGVSFGGSGSQRIYGAVLVNETATQPGVYESGISGIVKIRYSCEALTQAMNTRRSVTAANWQEQ